MSIKSRLSRLERRRPEKPPERCPDCGGLLPANRPDPETLLRAIFPDLEADETGALVPPAPKRETCPACGRRLDFWAEFDRQG